MYTDLRFLSRFQLGQFAFLTKINQICRKNIITAYTHECKDGYNIPEVSRLSVKDVVAQRFREICQERNITVNQLANRSGVTPSTAYSMLDDTCRDISIVTIKKFCDGLEMTLGEFFSTPEFEELEQEIK